MTEKQLQAAVVQLAQWSGWCVYHTYDSRRSAPGFPDLIMVRGKTLLAVELKSARGRLSVAQQDWLTLLDGVTTVDTRVWHPVDWLSGVIEQTLK